MRPISFSVAPVHFDFSGPFIRCLYSCDLLISGKMTAFICPHWIFNYPVVLIVRAHYSPVLCTVYVCNDAGFFWAAEFLPCSWPWEFLILVLWPLYYICVLVKRCTCFQSMCVVVLVLPLCHLVWRGVPNRAFAFFRALGSQWSSLFCSPSDVDQVLGVLSWWDDVLYTSDVMVQVCFTPLKGLHWGVMVLVARPCLIWPIVALVPLFVFLQIAGWGCMGLGSRGLLWGQL